MGARAPVHANNWKPPGQKSGEWWLLAPASLEALEAEGDQGFSRVLPAAALPPHHDQGAGGQRQRLIDREALTAVLRTNPAIGVQEHPAPFVGLGAVRPVLGHRWRQVATVLAQVEAGFCLDEVLHIDQGEVRPVVEKLVVLEVAVGGDGLLGWNFVVPGTNLFEKVPKQEIELGPGHLELFEPIPESIDFGCRRVGRAHFDARVMDVGDGAPGRFALVHKDIGVAIAFHIFAGQLGLQEEVELRVVAERFRQDELAVGAGGQVPERPHYVVGELPAATVLDLAVDGQRAIFADVRFILHQPRDLGQVLDPDAFQRPHRGLRPQAGMVRCQHRSHLLRIEHRGQLGEGRILGEEVQAQIEVGKDPRVASRVQGVGILAGNPFHPFRVVTKGGVIEDRPGPHQALHRGALRHQQLGFIDIPENPWRFKAAALDSTDLHDLDRREDRTDDLLSQELLDRLRLGERLDRGIGDAHGRLTTSLRQSLVCLARGKVGRHARHAGDLPVVNDRYLTNRRHNARGRAVRRPAMATSTPTMRARGPSWEPAPVLARVPAPCAAACCWAAAPLTAAAWAAPCEAVVVPAAPLAWVVTVSSWGNVEIAWTPVVAPAWPVLVRTAAAPTEPVVSVTLAPAWALTPLAGTEPTVSVPVAAPLVPVAWTEPVVSVAVPAPFAVAPVPCTLVWLAWPTVPAAEPLPLP